MKVIEKYDKEITTICVKHKVNKLYVFGSLLTNKFNEHSDIDFVVDFEPIELLDYADNFFDFKFSLQDILKYPIDLIEEKALKNRYFIAALNKQKQLIYGLRIKCEVIAL
jgi:predicted nucleotidyltransferase